MGVTYPLSWGNFSAALRTYSKNRCSAHYLFCECHLTCIWPPSTPDIGLYPTLRIRNTSHWFTPFHCILHSATPPWGLPMALNNTSDGHIWSWCITHYCTLQFTPPWGVTSYLRQSELKPRTQDCIATCKTINPTCNPFILYNVLNLWIYISIAHRE